MDKGSACIGADRDAPARCAGPCPGPSPGPRPAPRPGLLLDAVLRAVLDALLDALLDAGLDGGVAPRGPEPPLGRRVDDPGNRRSPLDQRDIDREILGDR